jgi:hypothetical protein
MRIIIEDATEPSIDVGRLPVPGGEVVDAGPAPTELIRRFAPELVVEPETEADETKKPTRSAKAETPANPLRAGAAVARRRAGARTASSEEANVSEAGRATKRRSAKKT